MTTAGRRCRGGLATAAALILVAALAQPGAAQKQTFRGSVGQIAFTRSGVLYTVNATGSGLRPVKVPQNVRPFDPAWSADGLWLAYASSGIWIQRRDGSGAKQLTRDPSDSDPAWAPDGKRLVFVRQVGPRARLFVVNTDGSGLANVALTFERNVDDPEWSPDGSQIAFNDTFDVYTVNADGSGLRSLTGGARGRPHAPSWSPDGSRIAYGALDGLWVVPAAGGAPQRLAGGFIPGRVDEIWEVSWSPDGSRIVFAADTGGAFQEELYLVNADGSGLQRLNVDADVNVDWGRAACLVPNVKGRPLAAAQAAITKARCAVGMVKQAFSSRVKQGRVISQRPAPGQYLVEGTKVSLVVSRGKRP
ncbi:MAG TPA: PASTA domain-containing protein [Gaiellaceae bacterium]|nr:PASTA domain-containing protein [Gaiellaceae bacterium]